MASGVCAALTDTDQITSTHRGHGHLVAKGGEFKPMMAELMAKSTGYNKGKGGSMHISNLDVGMLGANGIVGAGAPIAVGAGFANKYRDDGNVAVAFFGDGSTNIGAFHEAANMACALKLPVLFICENNEYGEFTPRDKTMAITDIVDRAAGYGMPGVIVDGMDVVAIHEAAIEAKKRALAGDGPSLIEAKTYRFYNHHGVQNLGLKYRTDDEVEVWKQRDPIFTFEDRMIEAGNATRDDFDTVWADLRADIDEAIEFAEDSPLPDPDQITGRRVLDDTRIRTDTVERASRELRHDPQDRLRAGLQRGGSPGDAGERRHLLCRRGHRRRSAACSRATPGLQKEFGERRVVDTPISEQAIIGLGVGAAVSGLRPIVDIMFMDFIAVAFDQIINQAAKVKYMFGGLGDRPDDDHDRRRRRPVGGGPAQPVARSADLPHPRLEGRVPVEPVRHEGPDDVVHPREQPDDHDQAQAVARHAGRGARGAVFDPARQGQRAA